MPRNSFVYTALEGGKSVASYLRIALAAWWNGELLTHGPPCAPSDGAGGGAGGSGGPGHPGDRTCLKPQPLAAFPELHRLSIHEPWLANPAVRVQCMWEQAGAGNQRYTYFLVSNNHRRTLGVLMREHELVYMRLHANFTFAAVDGTLLAGEIREAPLQRVFVTGGVDRQRHCTWSLLVVQRQRRYEMQITSGGLIPRTHDFRKLEDAMSSAEAWLTEFHHQNAPGAHDDPGDGGWLM